MVEDQAQEEDPAPQEVEVEVSSPEVQPVHQLPRQDPQCKDQPQPQLLPNKAEVCSVVEVLVPLS